MRTFNKINRYGNLAVYAANTSEFLGSIREDYDGSGAVDYVLNSRGGHSKRVHAERIGHSIQKATIILLSLDKRGA